MAALIVMRKHLLDLAVYFACCMAASAAPGSACLAWSEDSQTLQGRTVYFGSGRASLNAEAKRKVAEVGSFLRGNVSAAVRVEGHCDDRGSTEHNRWLGNRRAEAVRKELIRAGIEPVRIDTISFGEDRPVAPGHEKEARRKNRRAEFVILTPPK
jgi:peptidoglycan-associated lipoprotein